MSDIKISLDSSGASGSISVVRVDGVIDTMTSTELEKVMNSLLERGKYKIIVDLGGVDYISSAGWGIFISNIREIRQHTGDIKLARMIPNVYEIFELLEFDSILRAFDSIEKAKGDFDGEKSQSIVIPEPVASRQTIGISEAPKKQPVEKKIDPPPVRDIESEIRAESAVSRPETGPEKPAPKNIESVVLEMVSKDPFYTITEIKDEIARKQPGARAGWWKIWAILRKNGLLSKKNRFRRARNKSGES